VSWIQAGMMNNCGRQTVFDRHYSERLCSYRLYSDKCYSDWNLRRQTQHYALHAHSL